MRFRILGPLSLPTAPSGCRPLRGPKVRKLFALLLLRAGQVVSVDALVDELWGERPPRTCLATLRTHVYHLRLALNKVDEGLGDRVRATETAGYVLALPAHQVDAQVFCELAAQGRILLEGGDDQGAVRILRRALGMWRGNVLEDLFPGRPLRQHIDYLEQARIAALELLISAEMNLGRYRELIPQLRDLVASYPLHEWFHARHMEALFRSDRRGEALRAYQELRTVLDEELGLDPCPEVKSLHREILTSGT